MASPLEPHPPLRLYEIVLIFVTSLPGLFRDAQGDRHIEHGDNLLPGAAGSRQSAPHPQRGSGWND